MNTAEFKHFELGIPEIDDQHLYLLNKMDKVIFNRTCRDIHDYIRLIEEIRDELLFHLTYEEELMSGIKFPLLALHKIEHARLVKMIQDVIFEIKNDDTIDKFAYHIKLIGILKEIFIKHLEEHDFQFANFLTWKKEKNSRNKNVLSQEPVV